MRQHLFYDSPHVDIVGYIENPGPVTTGPHESGQPQLGQVLRHAGCLRPHQLGQFIDRVLAVKERPDDAQPGLVPQQLQHSDRRLKLFLGWHPRYLRYLVYLIYLLYLRSHVDTLPRISVDVAGSGPVGSEAVVRALI
jgi:hypothetical protein